jgi:hypothetical protein
MATRHAGDADPKGLDGIGGAPAGKRELKI